MGWVVLQLWGVTGMHWGVPEQGRTQEMGWGVLRARECP